MDYDFIHGSAVRQKFKDALRPLLAKGKQRETVK
jgi:hypothetical protein